MASFIEEEPLDQQEIAEILKNYKIQIAMEAILYYPLLKVSMGTAVFYAHLFFPL